MHLSRIKIENFRNFSDLDVDLSGNAVVVGENRVGKTNLIYALRLIFDPDLPDSARQLGISDFWDGLAALTKQTKVSIRVEIKDFENDPDVLALLTDYRLDNDPHTVRLSYELRARADLEGDPSSEEDFEFVCYGGENEAKRFGHSLRRRISMDVLPALRDAEGDLSTWRRSPLRPLIEEAFKDIDHDDLKKVAKAIEAATNKLSEFDEVNELEKSFAALFSEMSGPKQDVKPTLGFSPSDPDRLYRAVRVLIDDGARSIADASLGSANLIFLSLKSLEIRHLLEENRRDHTLLAIEEPEAHLHPHLQRSVYKHVFDSAGDDDATSPLSIFLTTHSPHIASIAPLHSILLLRQSENTGTQGFSAIDAQLSDSEVKDMERYLDVTRAEMLFSRGVILVEGDAERFLLPWFAERLGIMLDKLGITICSVSGTNFRPYAKFLVSLGIPFSVITDWDPQDGKEPLGYNRTLNLVADIETQRTGKRPATLIKELKALADYDKFSARCEAFGIFSNSSTLEFCLFEHQFSEPMISVLREHPFSPKRQQFISDWEKDPKTYDANELLSMIDSIGKGRFAQRLLSHVKRESPPFYIQRAIKFVVDRV